MKVRELVAQLQGFDQDADVQLFLNEVYVCPFDALDATDSADATAAEYGVPFEVTGSFVNGAALPSGAPPNAIMITVAPDSVRRQLESLKHSSEWMAEEHANAVKAAARSAMPAVASGGAEGAAAVALLVSQTTLNNLYEVVDACNQAHTDNDGACTHGTLTVPSLLAMLAEDAGMVFSRPGSWEGANMHTVLEGHGYSV